MKKIEEDRREREIAEVISTINGLNLRLNKADRALDRQEQYSRRNCLLIHGIGEENQENTVKVVLKTKWTRK